MINNQDLTHKYMRNLQGWCRAVICVTLDMFLLPAQATYIFLLSDRYSINNYIKDHKYNQLLSNHNLIKINSTLDMGSH